MNYNEVVQGVRQRYGNSVPPVDPEQEKRIMQNRAMFPDSVRAIERMRQQNENPQAEQKCPICGGTKYADMGYFQMDIGEYHFCDHCNCVEVEAAKRRIEKSGISQAMQGWTFDSFKTDEPFRQQMARLCASYVQAYLNADPSKPKPWLFLGGQPACGKTHLCSAVVNKLLSENVPCLYVSWSNEAKKLKALANDIRQQEEMNPLLCTPVLYLDDLFKSMRKTPPTPADISLAFDIIDGRINRNLTTIISSEWMIEELLQQDEATFSRLYDRVKNFNFSIPPDPKKNYRLYGDNE